MDAGELRVADGLLPADEEELHGAHQGQVPRRCG